VPLQTKMTITKPILPSELLNSFWHLGWMKKKRFCFWRSILVTLRYALYDYWISILDIIMFCFKSFVVKKVNLSVTDKMLNHAICLHNSVNVTRKKNVVYNTNVLLLYLNIIISFSCCLASSCFICNSLLLNNER